jgi:tetratricopeptide (TPR) repeat protein
MKICFAFCVLFLIHVDSKAQHKKKNQDKIDSLKQDLLSASGKNRLTFINELNLAYRDSSYDVALGYANDYYKLALTFGDSVCIVKGGRMIAYTLMDLSKNEEAVNLLVKALGIAKRNGEKLPELKSQVKFILNNVGLAFTMLDKYDVALDYHYQSLAIREEEGDKRSIRTALNNIGLVFYNMKDYDGAIQNYLKAVEISKALNDLSGQETVFINLGLAYDKIGKSKETIKFINMAFEICGQSCNENVMKEGFEGLGIANYSLGKFEEAKANLSKSLKIARMQNDNRFVCENLIGLGKIESSLNNGQVSLNYFKDALSLATKYKMPDYQISLYEEFSGIYKKRNDFKRAFFCQERYSQLKDSIYNNTSIKNLTKTQTDYAERENVKTIRAKDQILLLKEELISKQKLQTILMGSVVILLLLLTGILYKIYRDKLLINIKLDQKIKERTEELRNSNSHMIQVNELQQSLLQKMGSEGQSIVSGIKGLCHLAQLGTTENMVKESLKKVDENANKLSLLFQKTVNDFD